MMERRRVRTNEVPGTISSETVPPLSPMMPVSTVFINWGQTFSKATERGYQEPPEQEENRRVERATKLELGADTPWKVIFAIESQIRETEAREHKAKLGLSVDASVDEVLAAEKDVVRIIAARELGLADTASASEIDATLAERDARARSEKAQLLGLEPDADWSVIGEKEQDNERRTMATNLHLAPDASWDDIFLTLDKQQE
jgi:hypothetical protein